MSEDGMEQAPRRRSARIVALEEKRERQKKARKEAARKNCPGYKGKGKAVINGEVDCDFIDDDEDEEGDGHAPNNKKRGRKSRLLNQLISLTQPSHDGQYTEYSSGSRYGLPGVLPKDTLEFALDVLQRQDPDKFFAQPINPDKDYHKIVKEPMDFGTMRAKVHENMYTSMEQFERDVYLICSNAMNVNPSSTNPHKVAEAVKDEAWKVFHALSADPAFFDMSYFGLDQNKSRGRKHHGRQSRNSGRPRQLPSKRHGGNSGANNSMKAEVEKRQTYCPSGGDSIFSQVLNGPKSSLQPDKSCGDYQDSMVRFVEDMGTTVKKYAARKIESLRNSQFLLGEATKPNPLANFLNTTQPTSMMPPPPRPPPQAAVRVGRDAPRGMHYPVIPSRPLRIPGITPQAPPHQETRNMNMDRNGDYKGKKVMVDTRENWDAYAASILSGCFMNNNNGQERGRGMNFNGEGSSSNSNMASAFHPDRSPFLNMSSSFQAANQNQNQFMQWNDHPETSNARTNLVNTPANNGRDVTSRVWPSIVISGPQDQAQARPNAEPISSSGRHVFLRPEARRPSGQPLLSGNNFTNNNISEQSLLSQKLTEFDFSLLRQALWASSQQIPDTDQVTVNNFTWQSFMPQNNLSWQSYMPQQVPQEAMNMMPSYNNLSGHEPLLSHQQSLSSNSSNPMVNGYNNNNTLSGAGQSSFLPQQRPEDVGFNVTGWQARLLHNQPDFITLQSFLPQQKPQDSLMVAQAVTGYNNGNNPSHVPQWTEEVTSNNLYNMGNNTYHTDDFQTIWAPIDLNSVPFSEHANIYSAPPPALFDHSGNFLMQPEPKPDPAHMNPLGLFPRQIPMPAPSSAPLEMPMGLNAINYYVDNAMVGQSVAGGGGGGSTSTAQLQWDNDHQPNLSLQL